MLTCKEMSEIAPEYLDKQVSFLKRMEISLHKAICPNCRRYLKQLAQAFDFIQPDLIEKMPPEDLRQKLLVELERQQQNRRGDKAE